MASLPPQQQQQQQSRRTQSSQENASEPYQQAPRTESQARSTTSLDSQTVLLSTPTSNSAASPAEEESSSIKPSSTATAQAGNAVQELQEVRRCWICFSDESEDTPQSSPWRTPCPCALTAHEACLLDWIADIESPNGSRSTAVSADIKCPQCKSQIYLARPQSNLVEAYGALEKYASKLLLPGFATGAVYTLLLVMSHHGEHTVRAIFNTAEADAILAPRTYTGMNWLEREALARFPSVFGPFFRNWRGLRVEMGLPVIPAALVASRTTLADAVLPVLPILFFATHPPSSQTLSIGYWPPSAALTLVALPYIRSIYDEYLERVWGENERAWVKEVRPRLGENDEQDDDGNEHGNHDDDDDDGIEVDLEVELDFGLDANRVVGGNAVVPDADVPAADQHGWNRPDAANAELAEAVEAVAAAAEAQALEDAQQQNDHEHNHENNNNNNRERAGENRIDLLASAHSIADTVFGALLFPTVASASGELLKFLLPYSWTVAPKRGSGGWGPAVPTGLLQTKWGRSIVGGCLFVVLKDAVRIYCRWKMAVSFRARRVRDYDKRLGKLV